MNNFSLETVSHIPENITPETPLLILLHGYGSNKEDLFSFVSELPQDILMISAQAPIDLPFGGYAWYSITFDADENKFSDPVEGKASIQKIKNFIDEVIEHYGLNGKNINLLGFSQGAILSMAYSMTFPNQIKNVVALSGYFNNDFLLEAPKQNNTNYFVSHGTVDQVIPVEWARKTMPTLRALNIDVEYKEYPVGHGVHPNNFYDFKDWLVERV